MIEFKKCSSCRAEKPLDDFHNYKNSKDGKVHRCKDCARAGSLKCMRRKKGTRDKGLAIKAVRKYMAKRPEIPKASSIWYEYKIANKIELPSGHHAHHWSYNKPKDVIVLSLANHRKIHCYLGYDPETKLFKIKENGELLNTKEKHMDFIKSILVRSVSSVESIKE